MKNIFPAKNKNRIGKNNPNVRYVIIGILCNSCNKVLPTKNRKIFIKKVNVYVNK